MPLKPWPDKCGELLWALDELSELLNCIGPRTVSNLHPCSELLDVVSLEELLQDAAPRRFTKSLIEKVCRGAGLWGVVEDDQSFANCHQALLGG